MLYFLLINFPSEFSYWHYLAAIPPSVFAFCCLLHDTSNHCLQTQIQQLDPVADRRPRACVQTRFNMRETTDIGGRAHFWRAGPPRPPLFFHQFLRQFPPQPTKKGPPAPKPTPPRRPSPL